MDFEVNLCQLLCLSQPDGNPDIQYVMVFGEKYRITQEFVPGCCGIGARAMTFMPWNSEGENQWRGIEMLGGLWMSITRTAD
ncbi:MAG: hypothetical protein LBD15_01070 [Holosporales bacterium]|nr:hypothetical protein [Holosporales bacterium]